MRNCIAFVLASSFSLAACSGISSTAQSITYPSVPSPSVEVVSGQALGAQAAAIINGTTRAVFPELTFSGPVSTVIRNIQLGSLSGVRVFSTPKGSVTIRYVSGSAPHITGTLNDMGARTCIFSREAANGSYIVIAGTGSFAGAVGHGAYRLDFTIETAKPARGPCSMSGKPVPAGDQADFTASGPLMVPA